MSASKPDRQYQHRAGEPRPVNQGRARGVTKPPTRQRPAYRGQPADLIVVDDIDWTPTPASAPLLGAWWWDEDEVPRGTELHTLLTVPISETVAAEYDRARDSYRQAWARIAPKLYGGPPVSW
jgi:hypothetical protein